MPSAVIAFDLDPFLHLGDAVIRWETLGIAGSVLLALVAAALLARRIPPARDGRRLHLDDLLYIALGIVPGAVVGGRLGYALIHLDYYAGHPGALIDPSQGSLQLSAGIAGGLLTGFYVARILEAPAGRWAHVGALPMLLMIEGGKAAMAWGGRGQGQLSTVPWATAYLGPGPWGSLAPSLPAQPSQLYEAALAGAIAVALVVVAANGAFARRDGGQLLVAFAVWLAGRLLIATTWRDAVVLGPFRADQLLSIGLLALTLIVYVVVARRRPTQTAGPSLAWPDPEIARSWRDRMTPGR